MALSHAVLPHSAANGHAPAANGINGLLKPRGRPCKQTFLATSFLHTGYGQWLQGR